MSSAPQLQRIREESSAGKTWPPPWFTGAMVLPQGIYLGFLTTALPFLLSSAAVPVDRIARVTSLLSLPWVIGFLWAPIIDVKLPRKIWLLVTAAATALCLGAVLPLARAGNVALVCEVGFVGTAMASLVLATCGGLMVKTLSAPNQAKAAAWCEAGKLGGSGLGAAFMLWLVERNSPALTGALVAVVTVLPGFLALSIAEAKPEPSSWIKGRFHEIAKTLRLLALSPKTRWSIPLLISPVGTGAAVALLPAVAKNYGVGAEGVIWVNGIGGAAMLALGALSGTLIPAQWDRRLCYVGSGLLNVLAAVTLLCSYRPWAYYVGTTLYLATTGLCWARYGAMLAEVLSEIGRDVSTVYSVFTALSTAPMVYMVWLDGVGFEHFGIPGLFWMDSSGDLLVGLIVAMILGIRLLLRFRRTQRQAV